MALTMLLCVFSLALLSYGRHEAPEKPYPSGPIDACNQIAAAISGATQVYFPREPVILSSFVILRLMIDRASTNYLSDISHASLSSTEASACSVEPGSTEQADASVLEREACKISDK